MKMDARHVLAGAVAVALVTAAQPSKVGASAGFSECGDFYDWVQKLSGSGGWEYYDWHSTADEYSGTGYWYRGQLSEARQWPHPHMATDHFTDLDVQTEHPPCEDPG